MFTAGFPKINIYSLIQFPKGDLRGTALTELGDTSNGTTKGGETEGPRGTKWA